MKIGKSLGELAAEIERQAKTKKDYITGTQNMVAIPEPANQNSVQLKIADKPAMGITEIAHSQIAEFTGIPQRYYDRMRKEQPELLAKNINTWFQNTPAPRMVRTLDGNARALLSDKYRTLDNYDFAHATLPILSALNLDVASCDITERKLYIKAISPQLQRDVPVGYKMGDGSHRIFDTCAPVAILSNSEVGYGRLVIETGVYTKACTNLALFAGNGGLRRTHVGARHKLTDAFDVADLDDIMSQATKQRTMEALWLQVRDVVGAAFDEKVLTKRLEKLAATADNKITGKVEKVIEVVQERFGFNEIEKDSIFKHLIEGGNLSQYGLHAAITRAAQDVPSYDRATELEYAGGKVIELAAMDWNRIAEAA